MIRIPTNREPTHPGEMLREEFLIPLGLSQRDLAAGILVPFQRINELVNGKRGITPSTALRFSKFFGNSVGFWMNLQIAWDLYWAQKKEEKLLNKIKPMVYNNEIVPNTIHESGEEYAERDRK